MCVVEPESRITGKILEMLGSGDKSRYISNAEDMEAFTVSNVEKFYSNLFGKL